MGYVKQKVSGDRRARQAAGERLSSGLPGTAAEQQQALRAAIKRHAETLRRLAR